MSYDSLTRLREKYERLNELLVEVRVFGGSGPVEIALMYLLEIEIKETADELWRTFRVRV